MPYPLLLHPEPSRRLWGGGRLDRFLPGPALTGPLPLGELWLAFDDTVIAAGPLRGTTLGQAATELGGRLLGEVPLARYGPRVPLLAKLIDAADKLSIQVHPDDAFARAHEAASGHLGKSEAWLILESTPDAAVSWGWRRQVDAATVRRAVAAGTLETLMNRVPVAPGDVIYNPAGTVHAIGAGVYLFEIQQASDLTYRLYDYRRRGPDGRLRALHLDKALAVAELSAGERAKVAPRPAGGGWTELVRSEHFVLERRRLDGAFRGRTRPSSLELLCAVEGDFEVVAGEARVEAGVGRALVLPAGLGAYRLSGDADLLRSYLPAGPDP